MSKILFLGEHEQSEGELSMILKANSEEGADLYENGVTKRGRIGDDDIEIINGSGMAEADFQPCRLQ
jgi:hypothetical protein